MLLQHCNPAEPVPKKAKHTLRHVKVTADENTGTVYL